MVKAKRLSVQEHFVEHLPRNIEQHGIRNSSKLQPEETELDTKVNEFDSKIEIVEGVPVQGGGFGKFFAAKDRTCLRKSPTIFWAIYLDKKRRTANKMKS